MIYAIKQKFFFCSEHSAYYKRKQKELYFTNNTSIRKPSEIYNSTFINMIISKNAHAANMTPMIIMMTPATFAPGLCCVNILRLLMNPLQKSPTNNIHQPHN